MECWNVGPSIMPVFLLPHRLHRPNLCPGTRNRPLLVEESPASHYIMVEDSLAPQYIVVDESLVPMCGVKNRPCLVVESPEPTEDQATTTSPLPMSSTKDQRSLVDDSPAVLKVSNPCFGGENPVEGGSATLQIKLVSPPTTSFHVEDPHTQVVCNWSGGSRGSDGLGARICVPSVDPITLGGS